jgi:hypothetical protein
MDASIGEIASIINLSCHLCVVGEPIQQGSLIIHILRGPNVGPAISGTSGWWRWWFWCWSIRWGDWRGEESSRRTCSVCQGFCQEERMYVFDSTWHIPNFKLIWYLERIETKDIHAWCSVFSNSKSSEWNQKNQHRFKSNLHLKLIVNVNIFQAAKLLI